MDCITSMIVGGSFRTEVKVFVAKLYTEPQLCSHCGTPGLVATGIGDGCGGII